MKNIFKYIILIALIYFPISNLFARDFDYKINPYTGKFDMIRSSSSYDDHYISTDTFATLTTTYVNVTGDTMTGPLVNQSTITANAVGISTGIPQAALHVVGKTLIASPNNDNALEIKNSPIAYNDQPLFQPGITPTVSLVSGYDVLYVDPLINKIPNGSTVTGVMYSLAGTGTFVPKIYKYASPTITCVFVATTTLGGAAVNNATHVFGTNYVVPQDGANYYIGLRCTTACTIRTPTSGYTGGAAVVGCQPYKGVGNMAVGDSGSQSGTEAYMASLAPVIQYTYPTQTAVLVSSVGATTLLGPATCQNTLRVYGASALSTTASLICRNSAGTPRLYVTDAGRVGFGTESPQAPLDFGTNSTSGVPFWLFYGDGSTINMGLFRDVPVANNTSLLVNSSGGGTFSIGNTLAQPTPAIKNEWVKWDTNGNMQLNRANGSIPASRFHISSGTILIDGNTTQALITANGITVGSTTVSDFLSTSTCHMGSLTNYLYVSTDGFIQRYGNAQAYEDLRVPLVTTKQGALSKPDFSYTNIGYLFPQNDATEILYGSAQFEHSYTTGTTVFPHVHFEQTSSSTPTFKLDYMWTSLGVATSAFTTIQTTATVYTYTGGVIAQLANFPSIAGTEQSISSIFKFRLYRDDDRVTGDVLTTDFDIHFYKNTLGSRTETSK